MAARDGFSIIELLVALVLLAVGVVGVQTATARFARGVSAADRRTVAGQIAEDRIEQIRTDPEYTTLAARYAEAGTALDAPPGMTRRTVVTHHRDSTAAGVTDFVRITVTVEGPGLPRPVSRTISLGRP